MPPPAPSVLSPAFPPPELPLRQPNLAECPRALSQRCCIDTGACIGNTPGSAVIHVHYYMCWTAVGRHKWLVQAIRRSLDSAVKIAVLNRYDMYRPEFFTNNGELTMEN